VKGRKRFKRQTMVLLLTYLAGLPSYFLPAISSTRPACNYSRLAYIHVGEAR